MEIFGLLPGCPVYVASTVLEYFALFVNLVVNYRIFRSICCTKHTHT